MELLYETQVFDTESKLSATLLFVPLPLEAAPITLSFLADQLGLGIIQQLPSASLFPYALAASLSLKRGKKHRVGPSQDPYRSILVAEEEPIDAFHSGFRSALQTATEASDRALEPAARRPDLAFADQIVFSDFLVVESSPAHNDSVGEFFSKWKGDGGAASAAIVWSVVMNRPLLAIIAPIGVVLVRLSRGVGRALEEQSYRIVRQSLQRWKPPRTRKPKS